jgi:tetratricopeptide (TPR) repeat protein
MPFLPPEALADETSIAATSVRAVALARRGETRAALNLALQARRQAQGLETARGELAALNAAAMVHLIRGDAVSAVAASIDARGLADRVGDALLVGQAQVSLQLSAFILEAGEETLAALRVCADLGFDAGEPVLEARARIAIGVVLGDHGLYDAAAYEFERARGLVEAHPGLLSLARLTANIANLHRKRAAAWLAEGYEAKAMRECAAGLAVARRACEIAAAEEEVSVEIDALGISGCVLELRGEAARGRVLLRESIALGRASRCPGAIVWVLCELGRQALSGGDLDEAAAAYAEALELARELRPSRKIAIACLGLADVAARRGDVGQAGLWRERAAEETAAFEIARLQTRRQIR